LNTELIIELNLLINFFEKSIFLTYISSPSILHNISPKHVWASSVFSGKKNGLGQGQTKEKKKMYAIFLINEFSPSS
jgi:hypothetical protein